MRRILHVDMDAFFAAVEVRENPDLAGKPLIVGGRDALHGVVTTASYEARRYGVHSAMPMEEARRRCPEGIFVPARHGLYSETSARIMAIFRRYTPLVEPLSIDEAFLDVTGSRLLFGAATEIAVSIQETLEEEEGLSASIGVSYNKFLAKLASDMEKPHGLTVIRPEDLESRVWPLPVERMMGVGRRSLPALRRLGIRTIGALAHERPERLRPIFGKNAEDIIARAQGRDDRPVQTERLPKSFGREATFFESRQKSQALLRQLMDQTEDVAHRLRKAGMVGEVVTLKWRTSDFKTHTRQRQLSEPTASFEPLWQAVVALYETLPAQATLRLVGMSVAKLRFAEERQLSLFEAPPDTALDEALDAINEKFGPGTLRRAFQIERSHRDGDA